MNQHSKRREFLRVIGGVGITSMFAPNYVIGAKPSSALSRSGVLLEASPLPKLADGKLIPSIIYKWEEIISRSWDGQTRRRCGDYH